MNNCIPENTPHEFRVLKRDFFKLKEPRENGVFWPIYDQTKTFSTLFCPKCGQTKEVQTS